MRTELEAATRLEALYRSEGPKLQRSLLLFSGNADLANDAVAEAFAQALARGSAIRSPRAWVWRTAFRIAAGQLKERRPVEPMVSDDTYEITEDWLVLMAGLQLLSPNQRGAVVLRYLIGCPTPEIARVLGSTPPAVLVHLSQGRKRLRHYLEEHHGGP